MCWQGAWAIFTAVVQPWSKVPKKAWPWFFLELSRILKEQWPAVTVRGFQPSSSRLGQPRDISNLHPPKSKQSLSWIAIHGNSVCMRWLLTFKTLSALHWTATVKIQREILQSTQHYKSSCVSPFTGSVPRKKACWLPKRIRIHAAQLTASSLNH